MCILDRYLFWSFLKTLAIALVSLTGLFIVIDFFGNFDEFSRHGPAHGGWLALAAKYYAPRILSFFDSTSSILALIAALFTLVFLQTSNEMTAILAAGVPQRRIVAPLIFGGLLVIGLSVANREFALPQYRDTLSRNMQDIDGKRPRQVTPQWDHVTQVHLSGEKCFSKDSSLTQPSFQLPNDLQSTFGRFLAADLAFYQPPEGERPGGYLLRKLAKGNAFDKVPSGKVREQAVILTPRDAPWLKPGEVFVVSAIPFEQLAGGREWRAYSGTAELIVALGNPSLDYGPDMRVAVHKRLVQPLLDLALFFLGLPLVLTRERNNLLWSVGLCLAAVALYYMIVLASQWLGMKLIIDPVLAAWLPLLILVPLAAAVSDPIRCE